MRRWLHVALRLTLMAAFSPALDMQLSPRTRSSKLLYLKVVSGVLTVNAEATVRDHLCYADQSIPLYLQIALTVEPPDRKY